jgi:hypothetical protein
VTVHRRYADLAAMAIDFTLNPIDAEDLRRHLDTCTACRRLSDAMRTDAAAMRSIDFGPAPVIVRDRVAALALKGGSTNSPRLVLLLATGLLLMLAVFAGSAAVGAFLSQQRTIDLTGFDRIHWQTEVVDLRAADLWIEANGQRLSAMGAQVALTSDPSPDNLTLEATWQALGRETRLTMYFGADATSWWVNAIQAQTGQGKGEWAAVKGTFFRSAAGGTWTGNVDLPLRDTADASTVRVHIDRLSLAVSPRATVTQPNGAVPGVKPQPVKGNVFARGGALHCAGIFQMTPAEAHDLLLKRGYAVSWRYVKDNFSSVLTTPPDGVIYDGAAGSSGELIVFVAPPDAIPPIPTIDFSDCRNLNATPAPAS